MVDTINVYTNLYLSLMRKWVAITLVVSIAGLVHCMHDVILNVRRHKLHIIIYVSMHISSLHIQQNLS